MFLMFRKLLSRKDFKHIACASTLVPKEQRIKVGDCNVNYLKVGHGPHHVLLMPGTLGTIWTHFKPQIQGFDREKFTVIAWDPPGQGKSRPPEKDFSRRFHEVDADQILEFMEKLEIPKYSLVGWSGGGTACLLHSSKFPDKVNKLVVWGVSTFVLAGELETFKVVADINSWPKKLKEVMVKEYDTEKNLSEQFNNWLDRMTVMHYTCDSSTYSTLVRNLQCPTLIILGQQDSVVDLSHATYLHQNIKKSKLHVYPDGGHNIHLSHAKDFNERVQNFLLESSEKEV